LQDGNDPALSDLIGVDPFGDYFGNYDADEEEMGGNSNEND
jgi:hypothetical protein